MTNNDEKNLILPNGADEYRSIAYMVQKYGIRSVMGVLADVVQGYITCGNRMMLEKWGDKPDERHMIDTCDLPTVKANLEKDLY